MFKNVRGSLSEATLVEEIMQMFSIMRVMFFDARGCVGPANG